MVNSSSRFIFDILRLISTSNEAVSIPQISRTLKLAPTTTYRGIKTLESTGYVARQGYAPEYVVGDAAARLSHAVLARFKIRDLAMPFLRQLVNLTGESVSLNVSIGWYCVRLVSVKGSQEVVRLDPARRITEIDDGIAAKCILACLEPDEVRRFLRLRRPESSKARTNALLHELWEISWRGYTTQAGTDGNFDAIAVPIRGASVPLLASIYVEGPNVKLIGDKPQGDFESFMAIIKSLEKLVAANPEQLRNPYAHIDPEDIVFDRSVVSGKAADPKKPSRSRIGPARGKNARSRS